MARRSLAPVVPTIFLNAGAPDSPSAAPSLRTSASAAFRTSLSPQRATPSSSASRPFTTAGLAPPDSTLYPATFSSSAPASVPRQSAAIPLATVLRQDIGRLLVKSRSDRPQPGRRDRE